MKAIRLFTVLIFLSVLALSPAFAQKTDTTKTRKPVGFVDANGDGFNDNAPDHDGDGVPNGIDPDFKNANKGKRVGFVDANGDGINDRAPDHDGDGIPNGLDPDFRGPKTRNGGRGFVDQDGDGVADRPGPRRGLTPGRQGGVGPAGPGAGAGDCNCTVPGQGNGNGKGRK